ncbi:MAG: hypothetical protein IT212_07430 [Bacteroidia bacterium]|nr:hypothetical protein [Bacteroidia bacterium]
MIKVRKWTRKCPNYKRAVSSVATKLNVSEKLVERTVLNYLFRCKQAISQGHSVRFPKMLVISTWYWQIKQKRENMGYAQMKRRYGKKEYFKKHIAKKNKKSMCKNVNK